jgi:hypothetical protein
MKKYINNILGFLALIILMSACKKEGVLTAMEDVIFPSSSFTASVTNIVLTEENQNEELIRFNWGEVKYPIAAPVTYSLQITTPADTLSETPWANMYSIQGGEDVLTKSLTGKVLNEMAAGLDLVPNESNTIVVRVRSYMDREAYSKVITLSITPYKVITDFPSLWIAGDFQGWDIGNAVKISSFREEGIYEGYINITGATNEFKSYTFKEWDSQSYGAGVDPNTLIVANYAGANFIVPENGVYNIIVDLNTMTYLFTKVTWGILGDATPGGWDNDTPLIYDPVTNLWTVTADMKAGGFKFRANNDWKLDFGVNAEGKFANANHPHTGYTYDGSFDLITVPSTGNYTITLDLSEPGNFNYRLKKN